MMSDMTDQAVNSPLLDGSKVGTHSGIVLNTYEIPVDVVFTGEHDTVKVEYFDLT